MPGPMIRVRARSGHYPLVDVATGTPLHGRRAGRDRAHAALDEGEWLPDHPYYRRGVLDGSLELLEELSAEDAAARGIDPTFATVAVPPDAEHKVRRAAAAALGMKPLEE